MVKKHVYVHQIQAPADKNLLPLAAGLITSYAKSIPTILEHYDFDIKILREDPSDTVRAYIEPDVLAFSTYSWNFRQSLEIARIAKLVNPDVLVIFGGPMIALSQRSDELKVFFGNYPFVDIVVHGMGEWTFSEILLAHLEARSWDSIPGLSYRAPGTAGGFISTAPAIFNRDLNELSSPFLDGTFEEVLNCFGSHITGALWETNRGCPFHCTFCVQGDDIFNKVLMFDTKRLFVELEWMSKKGIEYIFATDANFGIKERDYEIAKLIADLKIRTGYPKFFIVNWMKNSSKRILLIAEALRQGGIESRMTLARQSFDDVTLEAIRRRNIKLSTYDEMKQEAAQTNVASYTELILGLPKDTHESFVHGLELAMDKHAAHVFIVYLCRLLDGTEMSTISDRQRYRYETRVCKVGFGRSGYVKGGVDEFEELVVGTSTMPVQDWRKAHTLACTALALYNSRLAFFVLNYLRQEYGIRLTDFFEYLIIEQSRSQGYSTLSKAVEVISKCQESILNEGSCLLSLDFTDNLLFEAHEVACVVLLNELDAFYNELWSLVNGYLESRGFIADTAVLKEVFYYQVALIPTWKTPVEQSLSFEFNIPQYFQALCTGEEPVPVRKEETSIVVDDEMGFIDDPVKFCKRKLTIAMFKIAQVKLISTDVGTGWNSLQMTSVYKNLEFI